MSYNNDKQLKWHEDNILSAELEKRSADYKCGVVKGISWEDAKVKILASRDGKDIRKRLHPDSQR